MTHPKLKESVCFYPIPGHAFHVYDIDTSRHFRMGEDEVSWLRQLDGATPTEDLAGRIPLEYRAEFLARVRAMDLLDGPRPKRQINPMNIKVIKGDPTRLLEKLSAISTPYRIALNISVIPALILNLLLGGAIWRIGPSMQAYGLNLGTVLGYLLAVGLAGLVHELSHALVARSFNVTVPTVGLMMMFLHPTFYADVSAINLLGSKTQRTAVLTAGVKSNNLMALIGFACFLSLPGYTIAPWFLAFAAMNIFLMIINLIPFVEYDGYYIFQELMGERNFAISALRNLMGKGEKRADYALYVVISQISKFAMVIAALSALRTGLFRIWQNSYMDYAFVAAMIVAYPVITFRSFRRAR